MSDPLMYQYSTTRETYTKWIETLKREQQETLKKLSEIESKIQYYNWQLNRQYK